MRRKHWLGKVIGLIIIVLGLAACQSEEAEPLPTLANATDLAGTLGVPPQDVLEVTLTAKVPTTAPSPTATREPSLTPLPSATSTEAPTNTPLATAIATSFFANPAPNRILFTSNLEGTTDLWAMNLDGTRPNPIFVDANSSVLSASCDPQGRALMFVSDVTGDREIYLLDYATTTYRPLTDTDGENYSPVWSPAGDKVAFVSTRNGNADIYIMDNGGGNIQQVTDSPNEEMWPSWSADGESIWYSAYVDNNWDVYVHTITENTQTDFTQSPDKNEQQPILSPDERYIAYVDVVTLAEGEAQGIYLLDIATQEQTLLNVNDRPAEQPVWLSPTTLLASSNLAADSIGIMQIDIPTNEHTILTPLNAVHRAAQPCFIPEDSPAEFPLVVTNILPTPTVAPTLTPESLPTETPVPTVGPDENTSAFTAVDEINNNWFVSSETWVSGELAAIAPPVPGNAPLQAFLIDNLLNLVWNDSAGAHVLSMAIEPYQGALEVTLIGYTINDFPGDLSLLADYDVRMREQILLNSIRFGEYHLDSVEITAVNITFVFEVPILLIDPATTSQYTASTASTSANWLISTERWTTFELSQLFTASVQSPTSVDFVEENIRYTWADENNAHVLIVQFLEENGDFNVTPISYEIDGNPANVEAARDYVFIIREGILLHSLPPGQFQLTRISFSDITIEMNFLIPPDFSSVP